MVVFDRLAVWSRNETAMTARIDGVDRVVPDVGVPVQIRRYRQVRHDRVRGGERSEGGVVVAGVVVEEAGVTGGGSGGVGDLPGIPQSLGGVFSPPRSDPQGR